MSGSDAFGALSREGPEGLGASEPRVAAFLIDWAWIHSGLPRAGIQRFSASGCIARDELINTTDGFIWGTGNHPNQSLVPGKPSGQSFPNCSLLESKFFGAFGLECLASGRRASPRE